MQAPEVESLGSTTPPEQTQAPDSQVNPWYSADTQDSAIAFPESDIDMNIPRKPDQGCSNMGNAASSPSRDVTPFREQNQNFGKINFGMFAVTNSEPYGFSHTEAGPSFDATRTATASKVASAASCFCKGICSWCHITENKASEARMSQWPRYYTSRLNISGTEADTYFCHRAHFSEEPAAWRACRISYGSQQKHWDQQTHDHGLSEVDLESPTTQASPPSYSDSNPHFGSAKDDNDLAEDSEVQYEQLVENIANLVIKSDLIGYLEDDCLPIIQYTHAYLENIQSHGDKMETYRRPSFQTTTFCAAGDDSSPDMEVQDTPAEATTNRKRKQGADGGNRRKRGDDDDGHPGRNDREDLDDRDDWSGDKKRARIDECQKFPCPYRKRNPTRFNVRDHQSCALNTFGSMALLK